MIDGHIITMPKVGLTSPRGAKGLIRHTGLTQVVRCLEWLTYSFGEIETSDLVVKGAESNHMESLEAHGVPDSNMRLKYKRYNHQFQ